MTAEIALLNQHGIALAADSVVSVGTPTQILKSYSSFTKLFPLRAHLPVGLMVYHLTSLDDVPWEAIVKRYSAERLPKDELPTLAEYAGDLREFLVNEASDLVSPGHQSAFFSKRVRQYYEFLRSQIDEATLDTDEQGTLAFAHDIFKKHSEELTHVPPFPNMVELQSKLRSQYRHHANTVMDQVFSDLTITPDARHALFSIAESLFTRKVFPDAFTGVVIGGFGKADPFPSIRAYRCYSVIAGELVFEVDDLPEADIGIENRAAVFPFAQSAEVQAFLRGRQPSYQSAVLGTLEHLIAAFASLKVEQKLPALAKAERDERAVSLAETLTKQYETRLSDLEKKWFESPMLRTIEFLPRSELAQLAESLVQITATRRKCQPGTETVGEPIDVAVISKGDGFVWYRRKET